MMMHSVKVRMMEIKWLKRFGTDFTDLVEIITEADCKGLYPTSFVSSLLSGYWDSYYE